MGAYIRWEFCVSEYGGAYIWGVLYSGFYSMPNIVDKIDSMSKILDIMGHISMKNSKNLFQVFSETM